MTILNQVVKKICKICNSKPTKSKRSLYCDNCFTQYTKERSVIRTRNYRIKLGTIKIGVGKGHANDSGDQDSQYKTGIRYFKKRRSVIKSERRFCERCKKDLLSAGKGQWAVHHKDHNRKHNIDSNFELLCKRCHQLEHNCTNNLPS